MGNGEKNEGDPYCIPTRYKASLGKGVRTDLSVNVKQEREIEGNKKE